LSVSVSARGKTESSSSKPAYELLKEMNEKDNAKSKMYKIDLLLKLISVLLKRILVIVLY